MRQNRIIGAGLLIFCAVAGYLTTGLDETTMEGQPGPRFFPVVIITLLAILSVILCVKKAPGESGSGKSDGTGAVGPSLVFFGLFLGGVAAMYFIGFALSMGLAVAAMLYAAGWSVPKSVLYSAVLAGGVYFLFDRLLEITLPNGTLVAAFFAS